MASVKLTCCRTVFAMCSCACASMHKARKIKRRNEFVMECFSRRWLAHVVFKGFELGSRKLPLPANRRSVTDTLRGNSMYETTIQHESAVTVCNRLTCPRVLAGAFWGCFFFLLLSSLLTKLGALCLWSFHVFLAKTGKCMKHDRSIQNLFWIQ